MMSHFYLVKQEPETEIMNHKPNLLQHCDLEMNGRDKWQRYTLKLHIKSCLLGSRSKQTDLMHKFNMEAHTERLEREEKEISI